MKASIVLLLLCITLHVAAQNDSLQTKLVRYKELYNKGLIDSAEYKALKEKVLGLYPTFIIQTHNTNRFTDSQGWTATQLYDSGRRDADLYFKSKPGVAVGTFFTSALASPLIGLIPTLMCGHTPPDRDRMWNKNPALLNSDDYVKGYTSVAKKKKRDNAWAGWGFGLIIDVAVGFGVGFSKH